MDHNFDTQATKTIDTTPARIWQALTDPAEVKQWMFGTNVKSTWKKGDTITYSGMWDGKPYEDHGTILEVVPEQKLKTSYFSPLSGKKDIPENYNVITYELKSANEGTAVTITQENNQSQKEADYMKDNWQQTLDALEKHIARA